MRFRLNIGAVVGFGALVMAGGAGAQDNLSYGKSPAQLFASDCAFCHKSPQGLAKGGGLFGVQGFLRQHYTASKETAAALAGYLESMDRAAGPAAGDARPRRARGEGKPAAKRPADAKAPDASATESKGTETEPAEAKPVEAKPAEAKPVEAKPAEPKVAEPKPVEAKPAETKPAETKPTEAKPAAEAKPAEAKPAEAPKSE